MAHKLSEAILRTLAYRDLFEYPLTPDEIWQFLIERKSQKAPVAQTLRKLAAKGVIGEKDGFYFLPNSVRVRRITKSEPASYGSKLVALRQKRELISQRKLQRARFYCRFLRLVPWVTAVFATGSVAAGNAKEQADLDILIVTSPRRLWLSRLFVFLILIALGAKRKRGLGPDPDKVCPNMFFTSAGLSLPKSERNLYTAHEIVQTRLLWERAPIYHQFLAENRWVKEVFPNWQEKSQDIYINYNNDVRNSRKRHTSFRPRIFVSLFDFLESVAYRIQLRFMAARRTKEIVTPERILFHSVDLPNLILKAYRKKLSGLEELQL